MRNVYAPFALCLLLAATVPATSQLLEPEEPEEKKLVHAAYDRHEIPGHYTLGFYADDGGSADELKIGKDATDFEVWIGVTGDSTRVFSGLAMSLEPPHGVELAGPILWIPREGLKESGDLLGAGIAAEFPRGCAEQVSPAPVMLGRIRFNIQAGINECVVIPAPHRRFGVTVELCDSERIWPKPYADAIGLTVKRKLGLWDQLTSWFK